MSKNNMSPSLQTRVQRSLYLQVYDTQIHMLRASENRATNFKTKFLKFYQHVATNIPSTLS